LIAPPILRGKNVLCASLEIDEMSGIVIIGTIALSSLQYHDRQTRFA
jgi:hypothetical protein